MKKLFYISILVFVLIPLQAYAQVCRSDGYSVFTINGMFTNEKGAIYNRDSLKKFLPSKFNNEEITLDYLHNPTHIGGIGEIFTASYQKFFDKEIVRDHDLIEILKDASEKVKTQKLLLVAHSQGNFYANSLYDLIAKEDEKIAKDSFGIYGVATPASRVAGNGKYFTSSSDKIINFVRAGGVLDVLPSNSNISFSPDDDPNGHNFSEIYLKYENERIVSEIESSLEKLSSNDRRNENTYCIAPPDVTLGHRIAEGFLFVVDPVANVGKFAITGTISGAKYLSSKFADAIIAFSNSLTGRGGAVAVVGYDQASQKSQESKETKRPNEEKDKKEEKKDDIKIKFSNPLESSSVSLPVGSNTDSSQPKNTDEVSKIVINYRRSSGGGSSSNVQVNESEDTEASTEEDLPEQDEEQEEELPEEIPEEEIPEESPEEELPVEENEEPEQNPVPSYAYTYNPKYSFGIDDEGRDWQVWAFNGSYVYDWTNTYVDGYLREQFKIHTIKGSFWCGQCLERGVFSRDPREGFDSADLTLFGLDNNPQNNMDGLQYDVAIQWNSLGYTYRIMKGDEVYAEGQNNEMEGVENLWTAWNGSYNHFQNFPSGDWIGDFPYSFLVGRTGGQSMVTKPYPIYVAPQVSSGSFLLLPTEGQFAETGIFPSQGRSDLTEFSFRVIYKNPDNNPPSHVNLLINDVSIKLEKISEGEGILSDGNFINGEMYGYSNSFPSGEYEYYFTTEDTLSGDLRVPESVERFKFKTIPSTYTYIPKYSFGIDDEGRDWQVWAFNGSHIYDWKNLYRNGFLRQEFKIKTMGPGLWCGQCLERGIFNHDPQKGFESSDVIISSLEKNPQNSMDESEYSVVIVWKATGYTYSIRKEGQLQESAEIIVEGLDENTWVGWDGSYNHFQTFPSGDWFSAEDSSFPGYSGGSNMILKPFPVYQSTLSL